MGNKGKGHHRILIQMPFIHQFVFRFFDVQCNAIGLYLPPSILVLQRSIINSSVFLFHAYLPPSPTISRCGQVISQSFSFLSAPFFILTKHSYLIFTKCYDDNHLTCPSRLFSENNILISDSWPFGFSSFWFTGVLLKQQVENEVLNGYGGAFVSIVEPPLRKFCGFCSIPQNVGVNVFEA